MFLKKFNTVKPNAYIPTSSSPNIFPIINKSSSKYITNPNVIARVLNTRLFVKSKYFRDKLKEKKVF